MIFIRSLRTVSPVIVVRRRKPRDWFVPSNFPPANASARIIFTAQRYLSVFDSSATGHHHPPLFPICTLPINGRWRPTGFTWRKITTPSVVINTESRSWRERVEREKRRQNGGTCNEPDVLAIQFSYPIVETFEGICFEKRSCARRIAGVFYFSNDDWPCLRSMRNIRRRVDEITIA